jgi:tetratricopeptide (TPR) repeat protein
VIEYIASQPEEERLALFALAQRALSGRDTEEKNLDEYILVVDAGIAEALRRSEAESDPERARAFLDQANIFSFNLLADVADCWPGEGSRPEQRHFIEGLRAAENCIRWRELLAKPPEKKAMAWWGKGMHLLSLGRIDEAAEAFRHTVELVMPDGGVPDRTSTDEQLLYSGYLAIAAIRQGDDAARRRYDAIIAALEQQLSEEATREDAEFCIAQLRTVEQRYLAESA